MLNFTRKLCGKLCVVIIIFVFAIIFNQKAKAQSWSSIGGLEWVYATAVYNGDLYAGGTFGIARWNGSSWVSVGSGVNGEVQALAVYNGSLYAGGQFTSAGGITVSFIAYWDGSAWNDPEGGTNSYVVALTVYSGSLIVGGYFTDANGTTANYIASWDGNSWSALGSGMGGSQGQVMALGVYNNNLYAAGFFTSAGGNSVSHIAKWNGSAWSDVGGGINWIVYALTVYNNELIAGGLFASAGGVTASDVAAWNGSSWSALGSGVGGGTYGYVFALTSYNNKLIAGGIYTTADGNSVDNIAQWDGSSWSAMSSGINNCGSTGGVFALTNFGSYVIAGGIFCEAGGVSCGNIAEWYAPNTPSAPVLYSPSNSATIVQLPVTLHWHSSSTATSYNLQVSTVSTFSSTIVNQSSITDTSHSVNTLLGNTTYYWKVQAVNSGGNSSWSSISHFTTRPDSMRLNLASGWNMISIYINPITPLLSSLMSPVTSNLLIMKDGAGSMYVPSFNINTIGSINYLNGYQIYMTAADSFNIVGTKLVPDSTPITLIQGWNLISYIRNSSMAIGTALSTITSNLVIAKDGLGNFYVPSFGINLIGNMLPGSGYQLYMSSGQTFHYPANTTSRLTDFTQTSPKADILKPEITNTGNDAALILNINSKYDGNEIGIYNSNNILIGSGKIQNGLAGITIWGDNEYSKTIEGAYNGEVLQAKMLDLSSGELIPLQLSNIDENLQLGHLSELNYSQNGFFTADALVNSDFSGINLSLNPNPISGLGTIQFSIADNSLVSLELYNLQGILVWSNIISDCQKGINQLSVDFMKIPDGIYQLVLKNGLEIKTDKIVILR